MVAGRIPPFSAGMTVRTLNKSPFTTNTMHPDRPWDNPPDASLGTPRGGWRWFSATACPRLKRARDEASYQKDYAARLAATTQTFLSVGGKPNFR